MKRLVDTYHPETIVSGKRTIRDGSRFNPYFPPPDERDRVIIQDGEVTDTVELMEKVVWKYLDDTKRIGPLLISRRLCSFPALSVVLCIMHD